MSGGDKAQLDRTTYSYPGLNLLRNYSQQGYKVYRSKRSFGVSDSPSRNCGTDVSLVINCPSGTSGIRNMASYILASGRYSGEGTYPIDLLNQVGFGRWDFIDPISTSYSLESYSVIFPSSNTSDSTDSNYYYYRMEKELPNGLKDIKYVYGSSVFIEENTSFVPTYKLLEEPEYHSVSESEANALLKMNP